jgi:predicted RNA-binding Zn ribbon-like protein
MGAHGPEERIPDLARLLAWMKEVDLLSTADAARAARGAKTSAARVVRDVRELRERLRAALEGRLRGKRDDRRLVARLNSILAGAPVTQRLRRDGDGFAFDYGRHVSGAADLVPRVAEQVARFLASDDVKLARPCAGSGCVLWFVDRTRNRSRHWCRMQTCGAKAKARAYYRRKKQTRASRA